MLKNYIAYDTKNKRFIYTVSAIYFPFHGIIRGDITKPSGILSNQPIEDCELFENTEIMDTEEHSIYAEVHIFSFKHKQKEFAKPSSYKGFFKWNNDKKSFVLYVFEDDLGLIEYGNYDNDNMFDFKIIDTIQENKLGLIKPQN